MAMPQLRHDETETVINATCFRLSNTTKPLLRHSRAAPYRENGLLHRSYFF